MKKSKLKQPEALFLGTRRVTEPARGTGRRQLMPGVILARGGNIRRNHTGAPDIERREKKKAVLRK